MMIDFETRMLAKIATSGTGNPTKRLAGDRPVIYTLREVVVKKDGWYGPHGHAVVLGESFRMPLPDALSAKALGRVEFI